MAHRVWLMACVLVATVAAGCADGEGPADGPVGTEDVEGCRVVAETSSSGVLRSASEFAAFWQDHCDGEPPTVQWSQQLVVYDAWGQRPTGGHAVRVADAALQGELLSVRFQRFQPAEHCPVAQVITYPTGVAITDARADAVRVEHVVETVSC